MSTLPSCPRCARTAYRLQRSPGVVGAYPCGCWISLATARRLADTFHAQRSRDA